MIAGTGGLRKIRFAMTDAERETRGARIDLLLVGIRIAVSAIYDLRQRRNV